MERGERWTEVSGSGKIGEGWNDESSVFGIRMAIH